MSLQTDCSRWLDHYQQDRSGQGGGTTASQRHCSVNTLCFCNFFHIFVVWLCIWKYYIWVDEKGHKEQMLWMLVASQIMLNFFSLQVCKWFCQDSRNPEIKVRSSPKEKLKMWIFGGWAPCLVWCDRWTPRAADAQIFVSKRSRRDIAQEKPPTITHTYTYKHQTFSGVQLPTSLCSLISGVRADACVSVCANVSALACCVLLDPGSIWLTQASQSSYQGEQMKSAMWRGVNRKNIPITLSLSLFTWFHLILHWGN